ncbi:MAG TPA: DNA repair protein RecN [Thermoanaerobaculia bacterium]|nr:DNA repair protein RecN [Thermoanaerobaculia bacterium]
MLTYLKVRNLAIVEELEIEPGPGLNVLTGETGAGKSLLVDSLGFLSGSRASSGMIRTGEEKMTAEAAFHLPASAVAGLQALGIEIEEDGPEAELVIRRDISEAGRSRVSVNGSVVSVKELAEVMAQALEIHGQHESRLRIAGRTFRELLDEYGNHGARLERVEELYRQWKDLSSRLEDLAGSERDRELRLDLLAYQISEISAANLETGEEESLREERAVLSNAQATIEATSAAFSLVSESEDSAIVLVGRAEQALAPLARLIGEIHEIHQQLEEVRIRLQESARSLASMAESVRHDPIRLEEIESRLALIERLKKKYGATISEVLSHLEKTRDEHEKLTNFASSLQRLTAEEEASLSAFREHARELSRLRQETAGRLRAAIETELEDLAMEGSRIEVRVVATPASGSRLEIDGERVAFGPDGYDRVELWIAANPGEDLSSIQKVASGGELSRVQLAIGAALFRKSQTGSSATLVFDEIDSGIGGVVADAVGMKLKELARTNQVICVTHLPQIASFGTTHFHVWKEEVGGRTRARVTRLDEREARIDELARMLGGSHAIDSARAHARELLDRPADRAPARARKRSPARAVS